MKLIDHLQLSLTNLWKSKLRTLLTTFGVIIGIAALAAMVAFGTGMQKNVTDTFNSLELFNYITVFSDSAEPRYPREKPDDADQKKEQEAPALNEEMLEKFKQIPGVETVFPDIRFPAEIFWENRHEFVLVQALPADLTASKFIKFRIGVPFTDDQADQMIISDSLLTRLGVRDFSLVLNQEIKLTTLSINFSQLTPMALSSMLGEGELPFIREDYHFHISGISELMGLGGPSPLRSDIVVPMGTSERMKTLPFTNLWELFRSRGKRSGYSLVNVRLSSPRMVDSVKSRISGLGYRSFAFIDQMEEIKTGFLFMDLILFAVGMIAIVVAALGIINTMVMSIMERYREIGVMKAVGAADGDIKKIFFFETGLIGAVGGIFGLILGWGVSLLINQIMNMILARQGVPFIQYFHFPWWICLGSILFSILVSLAAGTYPALRAARVDPVKALRHD